MAPMAALRRFEPLGGAVCIGDDSFSVVKAHCLAQWTPSGWMLFRSSRDRRGRYFAASCTEAEALAFIEHGEVARETEVLTQREQARRILASAIRDNFGADSVQAEQLFEALDLLAG